MTICLPNMTAAEAIGHAVQSGETVTLTTAQAGEIYGDLARMREGAPAWAWRPAAQPPLDGLLVVAKWAPHPPDTFQTIQTAFMECEQWYAWHYGSFASRLVPPVEWAMIAAQTSPVKVDARDDARVERSPTSYVEGHRDGMERAALLLIEEASSADKLIEEAANKGDSHAKMRLWAIRDAMLAMVSTVRAFKDAVVQHPTPRTDAEEARVVEASQGYLTSCVSADFARQLERELAAGDTNGHS